MATLSTNDRQVLEKLLQMGDGYVLNFRDRTFREFFRDDVRIDISDPKYNYASGSKANRMRGFWQISDDATVGRCIGKLIAYIDTQILLGSLKRQDFPDDLVQRGKSIAERLQGHKAIQSITTELDFLEKEFGTVSLETLGLDTKLVEILKQRLVEIKNCLNARSSLAVIFLCGSSLEGILLGIACLMPKDFNQSSSSPKDVSGKVKQFQDWTLNDFINVARDLGLLGEDVKKFSHVLREFRNYIHPYQQMSSGFDPDEHTAKICWQVLQAAVVQLSK